MTGLLPGAIRIASIVTLFLPGLTAVSQTCTGLGSVTLNVLATPEPEIDGPSSICAGESATLNVTNGPFSTYQWSNGTSNPSVTVNTAGTYTVTVSNSGGCTGTASHTLTVTSPPVAAFSVAGTTTCGGELTLTGSAGFAGYEWSTGETTQSITVTTSGTYTLTVTDFNGCTDDVSSIFTFQTALNVSVTGNTGLCEGASTTLSATPGLGSYEWSDGQSGESISISDPGTYTVTVTGNGGCTGTASTTVNNLPNPEPVINGPGSICSNANATLSVSGSYAGYLWSTGSGSASITTNTAGTYSVTTTSANGCTNSAEATLNVEQSPDPQINADPYNCDGQLTLDAGAGFAAYNWSTGDNSNSVIVSISGNYTVTVSAANGCTGTDVFFASVPVAPAVSITGNNQFCEGSSTLLQATPGFSTYIWSTAQTGQSISVGAGGDYGVTVTDVFGCTATDLFSVDELPVPSPAISGPTEVCEGEFAALMVSGAFSSYTWSNGLSGPVINVNQAGAYTVTVTSDNGCTGTDVQMLSVLPAPQPSISATTYQCDGQLTLDAGGAFSGYEWSNSQSGNFIAVNSSGFYTVTVTEANGCTGTDVFYADIPVDPEVTITGIAQFCEGGSAQLQATPGFNTYLWSSFQTSATISVASGGLYTVTVTDLYGCSATDAFTVDEFPAPVPVISGPAAVCQGQTATLEVQGLYSSYVWSNSQFTQSIELSQAGLYSVTVTDDNGCTGTDAQALTVLPVPQPAILADPYNCDGQLTLQAGSGFSAYAWSNGQSGSATSVTSSNDYTVTVTAANGCTGTDTFFADIPADPVVTIIGNTQFCQGGGSTLTATPAQYIYEWSTGEINPEITVTQTGNYEVTATDGFGCTATDVFSVQALNNPAPQIAGPGTICAGSSATFTVPGNFSAFIWSNGQNTAAITVSDPGTYSVTVTAVNGCTGTDTQTLALSTSLEPEIAQEPYACDGQVVLDAGAGFSTYEWSGGQNAQTIAVTAAGDYTVTVTDGTGCSGTDVISVTIPEAPAVSIAGPPAICQNTSAALAATPGFGSYAWSNSQVGPGINVNQAGVYTVTATDAFGCTATAVFDLTVNPLPNATVNGPAAICFNSSGVLNAAAGLQGYSWSTGETTPSISVGSAGSYTVTVTDANGCTATGSATVSVTTQLEPVVAALPYNCDGQFVLDAGSGYASYLWSNGQTTQTISFSSAGTYSVTVTDASGCTGTDSLFSTGVPPLPFVTISGDTAFCNGAATTLNATPGYAAYIWSTGDNTPFISTGISGPVSVTVTDAIGCTASDIAQLMQQPLPVPAVVGPAAICAGNAATLSLNASFSTVIWSGGQTTASILADSAGLYAVTVTDANGCTGSASASLAVNANPEPQIAELPYNCDARIDLSVDPGFSAYQWSGGQNTAGISATQSGTYSVTVTDANGCTGAASLSVNVPALTQVDISGIPQFCPGDSTILNASAGFQIYAWSAGPNTPQLIASQAGNYIVTATDALGCTSVASISVLQLDAPQPAISGPQAVCPGSTATLSAPVGFSNYLWSNGATASSVTVTPPVSVSLTVTDANGCSGSSALDVGVSNQLFPLINVLTQACEAQATLDAGTGFQNYTWNTGATTAQIVVSQPGTYTVTVSDGGGCTGTAAAIATIPVLPTVSITGDDRFCPGESASLQASAGFAAYAWSNGQTTASITANQGGPYSVTVTDANGCTAAAGFTVQALQAPVPQITGPAVVCGNTTVSLTAGNGFVAYAWSTGQTGAQISVNQAGTYSVTVTGANGCTGVAQTMLTPGTADSVFLQALTCFPQNVGVTWELFNGSNGCDSVVVTQTTLGGGFEASAAVSSNFNGFAVSCAGAADGAAAVSISGGQAPFQYQWNTGAGSAALSNIGAGAYSVTVTDAAGCSNTATVALDEPAPVVPVVTATGPDCSTPGVIAVQGVSGGTGPYTASLLQTNQMTDGNQTLFFDQLDAGMFALTITDANGCATEQQIELSPQESLLEMLGDTIEIAPGDTVALNAALNLIPVAINWSVSNGTALSCTDCLTPSLAPQTTTTVQLAVQGYGDCAAEGLFLILVKNGRELYIPNAFAPESGGENAGFTIFGDARLVNIRTLQIYDRWGDQMAVFEDIAPNHPELGWDGRFQGKQMPPGVYVFWAELEFSDGATEVFKGDVTLIR